MKRAFAIFLIFMTIVSLTAKGTTETGSPKSTKPIIAVSIIPQQYIVDTIAGDLVETVVLVGPGQNPHSYEPTPRQMATLSQADAWITSNTDFETALVSKIASMYPNLVLVDGTKGVNFRLLDEHEHEEGDEDHHDDDEAYGGNIDRHTWLGKEPMKIMARHITDTLIALDNENQVTYRNNLEGFLKRIDVLFDKLEKDLKQLEGKTVFVYHPSFGYLLDDFGITQRAVETGGKEPTAKHLNTLIQEAKAADIPAIFVQAQFPVNAAQNVASSIGAEVLPLDPLAYDWLKNIELIGNTLRRTLLESGNGETL